MTFGSPTPYWAHVAPPSVVRNTPTQVAAKSVLWVASRGSRMTRETGTSGRPLPSARVQFAPPSTVLAMRTRFNCGEIDVT